MEYLHLDRDNYISRELSYKVDSEVNLVGDISTLVRVVAVCELGSTVISIDSDIAASAFDWTLEGADSILHLHFNTLTDFDNYDGKVFDVTLVVFDAINTSGIRYIPFQMKVLKELV